LDIGSKRIGVALSDALGITAQGLLVLQRREGKNIFEEIKKIAEENDVNKVVIGLPLNMDGSSGSKAEEAVLFAEKMKNLLNVPVKLWDERLSTVQAENVLLEADQSRRKRKKTIDKLAAQLILQGYLESERSK